MTVTNATTAETWLACGYAALLTAFALGLEAVARHSHHRSQQYEVAGFRYDREHDVWECPAGQLLNRAETEVEYRIARYRAVASACNACPLKAGCTDSDRGREIEHHVDSWLQSELYRFERVVSVVLLLLASLILAVEIVRSHTLQDSILLAGLLAPVGVLVLRAITSLRAP